MTEAVKKKIRPHPGCRRGAILSGEELEKMAKEITSQPPEIVERLKKC